MEGYQLGRGKERMKEKVQWLTTTNWWEQNRQGAVKNSIANGEAKNSVRDLWTWTKGAGLLEGWGVLHRGGKGETIRTTITAWSIKYTDIEQNRLNYLKTTERTVYFSWMLKTIYIETSEEKPSSCRVNTNCCTFKSLMKYECLLH